jgi:hypothetical protein
MWGFERFSVPNLMRGRGEGPTNEWPEIWDDGKIASPPIQDFEMVIPLYQSVGNKAQKLLIIATE